MGAKRLKRRFDAEDEETGPERRCLVTGVSGPKEGLIRFVAAPDGTVVPDVAGRLPGRGFYLSPTRDAVETAIRKRLFARGAKQAVTVPPDLADQVEAALSRRALAALGQARGAGQLIAGATKVTELVSGKTAHMVVAVLLAGDAGRDALRRTRPMAGERPVISLFGTAELSLALGRENVVHAALTSGGLAVRFLAECGRLAGFRGAVQIESPPDGADEAKDGGAAGTVESR